jgi:hypothetical protein
VRAAKAETRAADLAPVIEELRAAGAVSLRAPEGLNARCVPTARGGGRWSAGQGGFDDLPRPNQNARSPARDGAGLRADQRNRSGAARPTMTDTPSRPEPEMTAAEGPGPISGRKG